MCISYLTKKEEGNEITIYHKGKPLHTVVLKKLLTDDSQEFSTVGVYVRIPDKEGHKYLSIREIRNLKDQG